MSIEEMHAQQDNLSQPSSTSSSSSSTSTLPDPSSMMTGLIRLMGLDPSKIGALALNGIVFIAQMVRIGYHYLVNGTVKAFWNWYTIMNFVAQRMYQTEQNCTETDGTCNYQPPPSPLPQFL